MNTPIAKEIVKECRHTCEIASSHGVSGACASCIAKHLPEPQMHQTGCAVYKSDKPRSCTCKPEPSEGVEAELVQVKAERDREVKAQQTLRIEWVEKSQRITALEEGLRKISKMQTGVGYKIEDARFIAQDLIGESDAQAR
jgi:hypothetical protein